MGLPHNDGTHTVAGDGRMMYSIIIPTLNEEHRLIQLVNQLRRVQCDATVEIIVVDGGSADDTVARAVTVADKVLEVNQGNRGVQLAYGADESSGDILWFLHADAYLSERLLIRKDIFQEMSKGLSTDNISAGYFPLFFYDNQQMFFRYLQRTSNWRARHLGLIFGDQGLFMTKETYQKVGGFSNEPLMEDWLISRLLRKKGRFYEHSASLGTSARRFNTGGKWRTHVKMHYIKLLFICGVSPKKLVNQYRTQPLEIVNSKERIND